jgi:hypothetical protein
MMQAKIIEQENEDQFSILKVKDFTLIKRIKTLLPVCGLFEFILRKCGPNAIAPNHAQVSMMVIKLTLCTFYLIKQA